MHNQTAQPPLVEELPPRRGPHWERGETYLITLRCGNCRLSIRAKLTKGHPATGLQGLTAPCPHCGCVEWYHPGAS